jgi:hypothetical protein
MKIRSARWGSGLAALALLGGMLLVERPARADEAACIAAAENELALRKAGKLRDALKELAVCAAATCSAEVRAECAQRIPQVQKALPTLLLAATDEGGKEVGAVTVTLDGAPFAASLDGRAVAVDPGTHTLRFEAAGKSPAEKTVIVHEGDKARRVAVVLAVAEEAPVVAAPIAAPEETPTTTSSHPWTTRKKAALASAVVGLVGVGVGSGFGIASFSQWSASKSDCSAAPAPCSSHAQAVSDQQAASTSAIVSNVAFGIGAAGIVTAAVLWLTAPSDRGPDGSGDKVSVRISPMVGGSASGVVLSGGF